jgi:hypothetical protein
MLQTHGWDAPRCGGSLQHLLPSPLHIAISLQRNLKRIGHGQPPRRDENKRVKARIVPQSWAMPPTEAAWAVETKPPTGAAERKAPAWGTDRGFSPHPSGKAPRMSGGKLSRM